MKILRTAANALDCDLVYALVPRTGSIQELIECRARTEAKGRVLCVEHSSAFLMKRFEWLLADDRWIEGDD